MASTSEDPAFRACGFCASIVHESVAVKKDMMSFLTEFLQLQKAKKEIQNERAVLPAKICITCYQDAYAAKRFKESCLKSIAKLTNKQEGKIIPRSWIIGWSTEEIEAAASRAEDVFLKSNKKSPEDALKAVKSNINEEDTSKITRSKTKSEDPVNTNKPKTNDEKMVSQNAKNNDVPTIKDHLKVQPVVEISWNERQLGEINLKRCEVTLNSIEAADFQGSPHLLPKEPTLHSTAFTAPSTNGISPLPPRAVPKTSPKVRFRICKEHFVPHYSLRNLKISPFIYHRYFNVLRYLGE
jgi:hypothetical protein